MQSDKSNATATSISKYPPGSFLEFINISVPLIISFLSISLMVSSDRFFLANYSIDAMNAVATAGTAVFIFFIFTMNIASIAEVFVGKHNGAKEYEKAAEPVWQMIWFSCASIIIFWPIAIFATDLLIPETLQKFGSPYFKLMLLFGPTVPLTYALYAFFSGIGKTKIILVTSVIGNLLNIILDYLLIFGYKDIIPELGSTGAAIGTVIAQICQVMILFSIFFNKNNRKIFKTCKFNFIPKLFIKSIKVGYPKAIAHSMELFTTLLVFYIVAKLGQNYITVFTIGQTIFILIVFVADGLSKAVTVIASNMIGSNQNNKIPQLIRSALKFHFLISSILFIFIVVWPNAIIDLFFIMDSGDVEIKNELLPEIILALKYLFLFFVIDVIIWIISAIFTAVEDTKFIMFTHSFFSWLGVFLIYLATKIYNISPATVWAIPPIYAIINLCVHIIRYFTVTKKTLKISA